MSILTEIFAHKKDEVERCQQECPLSAMRFMAEAALPALDFVAAIRRPPKPALIAEIKRASPSKGRLVKKLDPLKLAKLYMANGARAISVLTDEHYFQGHLEDLAMVRRQLSHLPLLRKDFIYHPYQVYESRATGSDAILLIVAGLDPGQLADLLRLSGELGMATLIEVHTMPELEQALALQPELVGINNRDLHTFHTDLQVTLDLSKFVPPEVTLVSESGIQADIDIQRLAQAGVQAILVGEALVTDPDPGGKVRQLARGSQPCEQAESLSVVKREAAGKC